MNGYLLCRPCGGLNDILCQIETCARYAFQHGRTLVIDTLNAEFQEPFDRYFRSPDPRIVMAGPEWLKALEAMSVRPAHLQGRLHDYPAHYSRTAGNWVSGDDERPLSFDFGQAHPEQLLVHHACGGGLDSLQALGRLRLVPEMAARLEQRQHTLGRGYLGVHVRHSDYRTRYREFLDHVAGLPGDKPILLCTDSHEVLQYARQRLGGRLRHFAHIPDNGGLPLHHDPAQNKARINADAILDLLMLARSEQLFITRLECGNVSGFSLLAAQLYRDKSRIDALLDRPARFPAGLNPQAGGGWA